MILERPMSQTASLRVLEGERWWGGAVQDGALMPFGERFFERDLACESGGNQSAPFLVSSAGRYIWCDEAIRFAFADRTLTVSSDGAAIEFGEGLTTLRAAYRHASAHHFPPSGKMPPEFCFASPQYNTWIEMGYEPTQNGVLHYAQSILDHGFPAGLLIIDDGWCQDYGTWRFDRAKFDDPKEMVARLKAMGFSVMLWLCPFVSPDGPAYRELAARELLLRDRAGEPVVRKWWNGYSAILDVTHPDGVAWLCSQLDAFTDDFGVAGFKFDAGDPEFYRPGDVGFRQATPVEHCEAWARIGLRYGASEYRACWKLGGQPLIQRLRDKHHAWGRNGLADLIPNGLAQGLSGHAFTCPDMVGGGDIGYVSDSAIDQELFVRITQCSALFPMIQFSVAPWRVLDPEHLGACQAAVALRQRLLPEILGLARHAAATGEPIIRPMAYVFPGSGMDDVTDQFMLGDDILVAPVLEKGATSRQVAFPAGTWQSETGATLSGAATVEVDAPLDRLPWFRRVN